MLPQTTAQQKRDPSFVVQPRYWVREDVVESAIPKYPEPLAAALKIGHRPSIQRVLCWWAAGYHLNRGEEEEGDKLLLARIDSTSTAPLTALSPTPDPHSRAVDLERDFPLDEKTWRRSASNWASPRTSPATLSARFSPKWFLGWRDICRSTDERTLIASCLPRVAVGHTFPLMFSPVFRPLRDSCCLANPEFVWSVDYVAGKSRRNAHYVLLVIEAVPGPSARDISDPSVHADRASRALAEWLLVHLPRTRLHRPRSGPPGKRLRRRRPSLPLGRRASLRDPLRAGRGVLSPLLAGRQ